MSQITPDLLKALAPGTKAELRDRFIPDLNLILPSYGICNELEVSAFLATACFESAYFKTMREYGKGAGRKYGKPDLVTGLIYYGRGIFQNTWKKGYQAFTNYVARNWDKIKHRAPVDSPPNFVLEPDLLATTFWAVEAACWYWQENNLAKYARMGLKGYHALQGLVNRGSAEKTALDYADRLNIYEALRRVMPDDFKLDSGEPSTDGTLTPSAPEQDERPILKLGSHGQWTLDVQTQLGISTSGIFDLGTDTAVRLFQKNHDLTPDGIVGPKTWAALDSEAVSGKPASDTVKTNSHTSLEDPVPEPEFKGTASDINNNIDGGVIGEIPTSQNVVVEKESPPVEEKPKGVLGALWAKVVTALGGSVGVDTITEKAQQAQALGLSERTWTFIFWAVIAGIVIWVAYHFVVQKVLPWGKWLLGRIRTHKLMDANSTATNTVLVESDPAKIAALEAAGWLVVRRG